MTEKGYKSLRDLYDALPERSSVKTPKQEFVNRLCDVTKKSESAVRGWLAGAYVPDDLTKSVLERELGIPSYVLFPSNTVKA